MHFSRILRVNILNIIFILFWNFLPFRVFPHIYNGLLKCDDPRIYSLTILAER